ncbi:MAG: PQQ-dependent sugar dehydrogenase [Planctomycetota bacterium]|nr:PQQ-dependent sugar dehydrogenase [Planctomycetota bacterium]
MRRKLLAGSLLALVVGGVAVYACFAGEVSGPIKPVGNNTPRQGGWKLETVTMGLMRPWAAEWLPDGKTMLITEREGRLRVVENGKLRMDVVEGLPDDLLASGQGGLLDIAIHPDFAKNRWVYLTYSAGTRRANQTQLARAKINKALTRLSNLEVLFKVNRVKSGGQHFGSRLLWLPDGTLLMSIGDGGNPPTKLGGRYIREYAQDLSAHLGKTVRMTADGKVPADNPFAGDKDPKTDPYVYTYGHRNIQGMALRPGTREVWVTEHGARGGDELNVIAKGANYGWPLATYSKEYFGPRISDKTTLKGAVDPRVVWTPCIAPSGLTFYTGSDFPDWRGDLLAGGLVLKQIRRVRFAKDGRIVGQTTLQFRQRIRWVEQGPDGKLYVLTDEIDGALRRIVPQ